MNDLEKHGLKLADSFPIAYVSLTVLDLEKSLEFYQSVIGFHVLLKMDRTAILGTFDGKPLLMLTQQSKAISREPGTTGIDHFALLVPNRLELARQLKRIKESNDTIFMISDHGVNESIYSRDPDGILVEITHDLTVEELVQRRPLRSQEIGDQLLNLTRQSYISEMSRDRKIGHVLLRVLNLSEAEQYYIGKFGFKVSMRIPGAVFVSSGIYHHHLGFHIWESEGGTPPDPFAIGLRYFGIFIEHHKIQKESLVKTDPVSLPRFVRDSSGNGIMLINHTYMKPQDLIELDQLFMIENKIT